MEKPKRKSWKTLAEDLKRIRRRPPDPKAVEEFNKIMEEDDRLEQERMERERQDKRIASPEAEGSGEATL